MKFPDSLRHRDGVVIDSNIFIYLFEDDGQFGESAEFIINQTEQGIFEGIITPITVAEILVKPLKFGRHDLAERCRFVLEHFTHIRTMGISQEAGVMAGALRAKYGLTLPDMFQIAVSLQFEHPAIITNDKALKCVDEVDVFTLDDF